MAFSSIRDITEGQVISFRSKNVNDPVFWQGTLELIGTYRAIQDRINPAAYNEAVRQSDPTVPSDLSLLTYFVITVDNSSTSPTMQVFAQEWITPGSLNVIALGNQVKLLVDDPNNNTQTILSLLASAGYFCKVIS
jgi:hypothetical protein